MYTVSAIEDIIRATLGDAATVAERHFLRQSLLNLVRLGQAEQRMDMVSSMDKVLQPAEVAAA